MIGNSSSGLVESSIFKIPSLSLGDRQKGKFFNKNVIFVKYNEREILSSLKLIQSEKFINTIKNMHSGYNVKNKNLSISKFVYNSLSNKKLIKKKFFDYFNEKKN